MSILADQATNIHPDFADVREKFALTNQYEILLTDEGSLGHSTSDVEVIPPTSRNIDAYRELAGDGRAHWRYGVYNADGTRISDEEWAAFNSEDELADVPFFRREGIKNTRNAIAPTKSGRFIVSNGMWLVGHETPDGIEVTSWDSHYARRRAEEKRQGDVFLAARPEIVALRPAWAEDTNVHVDGEGGWVDWSMSIGKVTVGVLVTINDDGIEVDEPIVRIHDAEELTLQDALTLASDLQASAIALAVEKTFASARTQKASEVSE